MPQQAGEQASKQASKLEKASHRILNHLFHVNSAHCPDSQFRVRRPKEHLTACFTDKQSRLHQTVELVRNTLSMEKLPFVEGLLESIPNPSLAKAQGHRSCRYSMFVTTSHCVGLEPPFVMVLLH